MNLPRYLITCQLVIALFLTGCKQQQPMGPAPKPQLLQSAAKKSDSVAVNAPRVTEAETVVPAQTADNKALFHRAEDLIAENDFEGAEAALAELLAVREKLTPNEVTRLTDLMERIEEKQQNYEDAARERLLTAAKAAVETGQLDTAVASLESLLAAAPTTEQSSQAQELQRVIDKRRTLHSRLAEGLKLLGSDDRAKVDAGQAILWQEQEAALPVLLESLQSENALAVANSLALLSKFQQPERTLPAILAILDREQQKSSWPTVIKELQKTQRPGAGGPLLQLALKAQSAERAAMLFDAVAGIAYPPPETLVLLLPKIYEDSPALAAALAAAYRAISVNRQYDLFTRRGLVIDLTPEQEQQVNGLPDRLQEIVSSPNKLPNHAEAAWAAQRLLIALRLKSPETFSGIKVLRASAESQEGPATAVLDRVWNSAEFKTMWRHPAKRYTTIVLDLGTERTVTGIRAWNYNEPNGTHRGWKDVEIFVSRESSPTVPVTTGTIPLAPGAANTPDYGAVLQVPFARGRYVKLRMLSVWRDDGVAGLSELEVLGY